MIYEFRNLNTIEDRKFEADSFIEALSLVSKEWFDGSPVIDFVRDDSSRVTLLSNNPHANVIGRVYFWD
jgi:hypothetical protein